MLHNGIIDYCIVCRLASGSLFKYFAHETGEVDSFYRLRLPEVVNIVLTYLDGRDRGKDLQCCDYIVLKVTIDIHIKGRTSLYNLYSIFTGYILTESLLLMEFAPSIAE
jgi:hypothetical protein